MAKIKGIQTLTQHSKLVSSQHSLESKSDVGSQTRAGVPRLPETAPPSDPTVGLCLGS